MRISALTVGPLEENCWLLHDDVSGEVVLVDPGDEAERICDAVAQTGGTLTAIWLTHAHFDHVGALVGVKRVFPDVPVLLHAADGPVFAFASRAAASYGVRLEQPDAPEGELREGDVVKCGDTTFEVWHLPGHSPGHVAFIGGGMMIGGDLLFAGSIGRSDLPLSDPAALDHSLRRVATLPAETTVHPGHGPATSIGRELRSNPFLNGTALIPSR